VDVDTGEECVVAHNLFGKIRDWYAVSVNLDQRSRVVGGRVGLCRRHKVLNNVFMECPKRIMFSRVEDNQSDGNLFDQRNDVTSLCVEYPEPQALVNLSAWQEYYGLDKNSQHAQIQADFDPETLKLSLTVDGDLPECRPVTELYEGDVVQSPGPMNIKPGRQKYQVRAGR